MINLHYLSDSLDKYLQISTELKIYQSNGCINIFNQHLFTELQIKLYNLQCCALLRDYSTISRFAAFNTSLNSRNPHNQNITQMEKDYLKSKKYTQDELNNLDIPYKFRDFCQDDYSDYISCVRTHPRVFENSFIYSFPFSESISNCKFLRKKWQKCEDYRQKEVFEEMKKIYDLQKDLV